VQDLKELDYYAYSGHSRLMAKIKDQWQDVVTVLALFGGGGLIRSAGGWGVLKSLGPHTGPTKLINLFFLHNIKFNSLICPLCRY
jgi:hypothetical protein